MTTRVHTAPGNVSVEEGVVIVEGSIGPLTMTPSAAIETSRRLLDAALEAKACADAAEPGGPLVDRN